MPRSTPGELQCGAGGASRHTDARVVVEVDQLVDQFVDLTRDLLGVTRLRVRVRERRPRQGSGADAARPASRAPRVRDVDARRADRRARSPSAQRRKAADRPFGVAGERPPIRMRREGCRSRRRTSRPGRSSRRRSRRWDRSNRRPRRGGHRVRRSSRPRRPAGLRRTAASTRACGSAIACVVGVDHRLVDERDEQVEHVDGLDVASGADALGRVEREAAGEHREPPEQRPLALGQQVVAPVDRRLQRLLARQRACARRR